MGSLEDILRIKKEQQSKMSWFNEIKKPFIFIRYGVFPAVEYAPNFHINTQKWTKVFKDELKEKHPHVEVEPSRDMISFVLDLAYFEDEQDVENFLTILYSVEEKIQETEKVRKIIREKS